MRNCPADVLPDEDLVPLAGEGGEEAAEGGDQAPRHRHQPRGLPPATRGDVVTRANIKTSDSIETRGVYSYKRVLLKITRSFTIIAFY